MGALSMSELGVYGAPAIAAQNGGGVNPYYGPGVADGYPQPAMAGPNGGQPAMANTPGTYSYAPGANAATAWIFIIFLGLVGVRVAWELGPAE